jgi:hypothetical protein
MEPEPEPQRPGFGLPQLVMCTGLVLLCVLSLYGNWLALGFLVMLAGAGMCYYAQSRWEEGHQAWAVDHEEWKAIQTKVWLQWRAKQKLWPCPTCGKRSCSNQHSETDTVIARTGRGRYEASPSFPLNLILMG